MCEPPCRRLVRANRRDPDLRGGFLTTAPESRPAHRRGWCSLYAALSRGHIDAESVRDLLAEQPFDSRPAADRNAVYAVDVSVWPRCDAESSPERGYYCHASRHSAEQPIVAGWAYQIVAQLSFARDSWAAPMDARRGKPGEDANDAAVEQVRASVARVTQRGEAPPLFVFDAGYDPVGHVPAGRDPRGRDTLKASVVRNNLEGSTRRPFVFPRRAANPVRLKQ